MRLAIGLLVSSGYRCETDFLFGRADTPNEGLFSLMTRLNSGAANQALPPHLQLTGIRTIISRKFPTDVARNEVCDAVLKGDEDYLLFLDADMVHPANLVELLLRENVPVITARYHIKKSPFAAIAYVKHRTQDGPHRYASIHFGKGTFEIERAGAGALLIRRDVLEDIRRAQLDRWERLMASEDYHRLPEWARLYLPRTPLVQWFRYQQGPKDGEDLNVSEDFWFWQQAREAGHKGFVNWDLECPHIGPMPIDGSWNGPFLHRQVSQTDAPETRDMVLQNTIVRGYPDGLYLGEDEQYHIPEYQLTAGER